MKARNHPAAKPIVSVFYAPPQRPTDVQQRYQMSTWNLLQFQLYHLLRVMALFESGQWITFPGHSKPTLTFLRLGLVITDLMEARMISSTPSNFAIACNSILGIPHHPVPTTVPEGAPVAPEVNDGDDFESDTEEANERRVQPVVRVAAAAAGAAPFTYEVLMQAVMEVEQRPAVSVICLQNTVSVS